MSVCNSALLYVYIILYVCVADWEKWSTIYWDKGQCLFIQVEKSFQMKLYVEMLVQKVYKQELQLAVA